MKYNITHIKNKILSGSERTILIKKNIIASSLLKGISIIVSLLVVSTTIKYINAERYGIWLTLSSIITWVSYFDFGFAHGFRNRFTEALALNNDKLARKYVSTTYAVLAILFTVIMVIISTVNYYLNWSEILNVDNTLNNELKDVFQILIIFFCINIVANIFSTMLTANQRPAITATIKTIGNVLSLITIFILTKTTTGNLEYLAFALSGVPCIFTLFVSIFAFKGKEYKKYSPSIKHIDFSLTRNIIGMGGQFFIIMISMLLIFQCINIIISRELGAEAVTTYNVTSKIFGIVEMIIMIILTPIWSAYTDAYTKKDYKWMKNCSIKLEKIGLLSIPILIIILITSPYIFKIWLGNNVNTSIYVSSAIAFFIFCRIMANIYMYQINGTGKVRLQMITYLTIAIFAIPILIYSCRYLGLVGVVIIPSITFLIQFIISRIQLNKIINKEDTGIWGE